VAEKVRSTLNRLFTVTAKWVITKTSDVCY